MIYEMEVFEMRSVRCIYRVEADNIYEARDLAICGETLFEEEMPASYEVVAREIASDPLDWVVYEQS